MDQDQEQRIREKAYYLWEKEGSPEGRDLEFWERARLMVNGEDAGSTGTEDRHYSEEDRKADEAAKESFPASDPPAHPAKVAARPT